MENVITTQGNWATNRDTQQYNSNLLEKWNGFADKQANNKTLWFIVSLIAQGVLFLPIPAALIFYFNAPIVLLAISLVLYFANIIAGMGGAGIRVLLLVFASSIIIHLLMITAFVF